MSDDDWPDGWQPLGMIDDGDSPEQVFDRLNAYVREHFVEVEREELGNGAWLGRLARKPAEVQPAHTHCTCAVHGILDSRVIPVRVYSDRCGLLGHRLQARPPRQEP